MQPNKVIYDVKGNTFVHLENMIEIKETYV
jgi:hypothetical protein